MTKSIRVKSPRLIAGSVRLLGNVTIGARTKIYDCSIVGFPNRDKKFFARHSERNVEIGDRCIIYPWCLIYEGASLAAEVEVHERCMVGSLTAVGERSMILYGAQVHDNVKIGRSCIIAGFIADNCFIGDGTSVFGSLIHRYKNPGRNKWDSTNEKGPTLGKNVVIGWGAVIVGPVHVGDGARVGANAVLRRSLPAGAQYGVK